MGIFNRKKKDESKEEEKKDRTASDKVENIGFSMLSSLLRGLGYGGALVDTIVAVSREAAIQRGKKSPDYEEAVWNVFDFSPAIDSKVRKLRAAANTFKYNRKEIQRRGFNIEPNSNVILVEDVITTGKSAIECIEELNKIGVNFLGTACLIDRTNSESKLKNLISVHKVDIPIYDENSLPDNLKTIDPVKPGSRDI